MNIAPVAFFVFNRPAHTARVFECIRRAKPNRLFLVADGPRAQCPEDAEKCRSVRAILDGIDWPCEVAKDFAEANLGCKRRVSSGLDWIFSQVPEAIILEDDCLADDSFFQFCTTLLERYRDDARIMHITGNNFQKSRSPVKASYYFSNYAHIWGWASWRRAWRYYDVAMPSWPQSKRKKIMSRIFKNPLEARYWTHIFDSVHAGQVDTWDYQWIYTCMWRNGLSILPAVNLVTNIGSGPDATHTTGEIGALEIPRGKLEVMMHPEAVVRDVEADNFDYQERWGGRHLEAELRKEVQEEKSLLRRARRILGKGMRSLGLRRPNQTKT